jgi:hypothetical protein
LAEEVEEISDDDQVSRHIDFPHKFNEYNDLLWGTAFMFSDGCESLVWRKYKPTIDEVHALGCERETEKKAHKPEYRYVGALSAGVRPLRLAKTARGHGFSVEHHPEDGQGAHHAELHLTHGGGPPIAKLDRAELRVLLEVIFGGSLEPCTCPQPDHTAVLV